MEDFLHSHLNESTSLLLLLVVIVVSLGVLGKAADWLVHAAVGLSVKTGLPKVVIGATVVSLGTTSPETAVSVMAALDGNPGLALGNAVGSVICDTGLILGLAAVLRPLPLDSVNVPRQANVQLGAAFLMVLACWPLLEPGAAFRTGGNLSQFLGFFFLALLVGYLWLSVKWARQQRGPSGLEGEEFDGASSKRDTWVLVLKIVGSLALVILSSKVLIPSVDGLATKAGVPPSIISATLVAFGTSLPELVTAITATLRGHGELAIGNAIGADILNVLFVAGASAAVTRTGLAAEPHFFYFLFPTMVVLIAVLRGGIAFGGKHLSRKVGIALLALYGVFIVLNTLFFAG